MKSKKLNKKLVLKKETVVDLRGKEQSLIKGGATVPCSDTCTRPACCPTIYHRTCDCY